MGEETLISLANAPTVGLLSVIVILLIALIGVLIRNNAKAVELADRRSDKQIGDLQVEVISLKAQVSALEKQGLQFLERAIRAEINIERLTERGKNDQAEIASLKELLTRTQARVIQLVNVLILQGISVPDEVTSALQEAIIKAVPKPEGAEPLSSDIEIAKNAPPAEIDMVKPPDTPPVESAAVAPTEDKPPDA